MAIVQVGAPTRVGSWRGPNGESDPEELLPYVLHGASVAEHTGTATDANPMQVDSGAAEQTEVPQALDAGTIVATAGDGKVTITEGTPPSGGTGSYTRQLYRSTSSGVKGSALSGATSLPYEDEDVENDETYYYTLTVSDGETTADTPQVSATPVAPSPDWPNMPAGWVINSQNDFSASNGNNDDFDFVNRAGSYVNDTEDESAPLSPPKIGRARYTTSFSGGNEPFTIYDGSAGGGSARIYIGFWVRFSDNWYGHSSGVNKILHCWGAGAGGSTLVFSATGDGNNSLFAQLRTQFSVSPTNYNPNLASGTIPRGQWVRWETLINASTGLTEWWITVLGNDPVKVGSRTIDYGTLSTWGQIEWAPTWGGVGGNPPETQFQDMDHLVIAIPDD